jgi:hypothetical protein
MTHEDEIVIDHASRQPVRNIMYREAGKPTKEIEKFTKDIIDRFNASQVIDENKDI